MINQIKKKGKQYSPIHESSRSKDLQIEEVISALNNDIKDVPVFWSPAVYKSEDVLVYEKPTPAGDSRNSKFATAQILKTKKNELYTKGR